MKRINLKGLSEVLSERELKNVLGGSGDDSNECCLTCRDHNECIPCYGECEYNEGKTRVDCIAGPASGGGGFIQCVN